MVKTRSRITESSPKDTDLRLGEWDGRPPFPKEVCEAAARHAHRRIDRFLSTNSRSCARVACRGEPGVNHGLRTVVLIGQPPSPRWKTRSRYPPTWKEISRKIRARAGGQCEGGGVRNGAIGDRLPNGQFEELDELEAEVAECLDGLKVIKIVLTVAHLNHDPLDCREENLRTLCQACHNRLAAPLRAQHASATRFKKRVGGTQEERPF